MLETLEVDVQRMRTNLDAAGPAVMAEARRVREGGALPADAPESYLGSTAELVERALAAHREAGR